MARGVVSHRASSQLLDASACLAIAAAGAAALEFAVLPGILVGGVVWLAPRALPKLRLFRRRARPSRVAADLSDAQVLASGVKGKSFLGLRDFALTRSAAKTVTFRVVSSGLDFGWNYFLLGELATAAGLSGVSLVAAPTFYFLHETLWNGYWSKNRPKPAAQTPVAAAPKMSGVSPAVAKTITFRTFATISEFSVNYAFVQEAVLAAQLSAFGVIAGPFVYIAHEKAWDYYSPTGPRPRAGKALDPVAAPA